MISRRFILLSGFSAAVGMTLSGRSGYLPNPMPETLAQDQVAKLCNALFDAVVRMKDVQPPLVLLGRTERRYPAASALIERLVEGVDASKIGTHISSMQINDSNEPDNILRDAIDPTRTHRLKAILREGVIEPDLRRVNYIVIEATARGIALRQHLAGSDIPRDGPYYDVPQNMTVVDANNCAVQAMRDYAERAEAARGRGR